MNLQKWISQSKFTVWDTGGNCLAYGLHLKDNDGPYVLVTADEGASLPENEEPVRVGLYNEDSSRWMTWVFPAADAVDGIKDLLDACDGSTEMTWQ